MSGIDKQHWLAAVKKHQGLEGQAHIDGDYPEAAVLVALLEDRGEPSVLLTQRALHLKLHAGEPAFPGGKRDQQDSSLLATALRESEEEIGLQPENFEWLFTMAPRLTLTGINVTPFVGLIPPALELAPNPDEIAAVFTVPLDFLCDRNNLIITEFDFCGRRIATPRFSYQGQDIFGMTARTLVDLVNQVFDAGLHYHRDLGPVKG